MTIWRAAADGPPVEPVSVLDRRGLRIVVVSAEGRGQTPISSFDDALGACGVLNYNLIPVSSVIPPGSEVVALERRTSPPDEFGHKLFAVKAEARSAEPGAVAGAGIGWIQWRDGRGVFVETEVVARGEPCEAVTASLTAHLHAAMADLCAHRSVPFDAARVRSRLVVARVREQPTTALVLAVYQAEAWR